MIVQAMMLQALGPQEMFRLMKLPPYDQPVAPSARGQRRRPSRTLRLRQIFKPAIG